MIWLRTSRDWCAAFLFSSSLLFSIQAMSAAATTPAIPLPENHVLVLRITTRAHSSHYENNYIRVYSSYESASEYLLSKFSEGGSAFEAWQDVNEEKDEDDPEYETIEYVRSRMTPEKLKHFCENGILGDPLFAPFSEAWGAALYELHLDLVEVE